MIKPSNYHKEGDTCAEALIKSYNEEMNTDIPIAIGSGMGVGISVGSLCGAVNAAVVIIGYIKGREGNSDKNVARRYSKSFLIKIKEKYNSEICLDLKRDKINCSEIIDFSHEALKEILAR